MAHIHMNFASTVLHHGVTCGVIIPERTGRWLNLTDGAVRKPSVLWLLHDYGSNDTDWSRLSSVERYANRRGLAVVMPSVDHSYYTNMAHGGRYFDYIANELPAIMQRYYGFSENRDENYIAGVGMGGYGALKIALSNPGKYAAAGCISSGFISLPDDTSSLCKHSEEYTRYDSRVLAGTEEDCLAAAKQIIADGIPAPRIYHTIGTTDRYLPIAHQTRDFFLSLDGNVFDYTYEEYPAEHNWDFYDSAIERFITFALPE